MDNMQARIIADGIKEAGTSLKEGLTEVAKSLRGANNESISYRLWQLTNAIERIAKSAEAASAKTIADKIEGGDK